MTHSVPYLRELEAVSKFLHGEIPNFPNGGCKIASRTVYEVIGLKEVAGVFVFTDDDRKPEGHRWNFDEERRLYVDLSQHQFSDKTGYIIQPITILPENAPELRISKDPALLIEKPKVSHLVAQIKAHLKQNQNPK